MLGVRQNCGPFLTLVLIFSDGREQVVILPTSNESNAVGIKGNNQTKYLLILTAQQNCASGNSGFSEIQFYGHKVESKLDIDKAAYQHMIANYNIITLQNNVL